MADAKPDQKEAAAEYVVVQHMTYKSKSEGGERMAEVGEKIPADDISKEHAEIFLSLGYMREKGGK